MCGMQKRIVSLQCEGTVGEYTEVIRQRRKPSTPDLAKNPSYIPEKPGKLHPRSVQGTVGVANDGIQSSAQTITLVCSQSSDCPGVLPVEMPLRHHFAPDVLHRIGTIPTSFFS
jgi:hypothetical protein